MTGRHPGRSREILHLPLGKESSRAQQKPGPSRILLSCISTLSTGTHLKPEPAPAILASFPLCARALLVSPAKLGKNVCWGVVFLEKEWYQFTHTQLPGKTPLPMCTMSASVRVTATVPASWQG